uniref:Uncharacterized protein n=1 Tax=Triticum urartu TaxID=4572 RepID=A0A8R7QFS9_TRIUA
MFIFCTGMVCPVCRCPGAPCFSFVPADEVLEVFDVVLDDFLLYEDDAASKIKFRQNILEMGQQIMIYLCLIRSNLISRGTKLWEIEGEVYCQQ